MTINFEFSPQDHEPILFHNELNDRIQISPKYFEMGLSPYPLMVGRKAVLNRLLLALNFLPSQYGFLILDVYRPRSVQAKIFEWMRNEISKRSPDLSADALYQETKKFASPPSKIGESRVPPHLSGGAIDLTLYDMKTKQELDMGTPFDDCTEKANHNYYQNKSNLTDTEIKIHHNRMALLSAMQEVGFTPHDVEWWHYDLGDCLWSNKINLPAVFGPLFGDLEWNEKALQGQR